MRWTKGKPADKAPLNTPLLVAFDFEGRRYYRIAQRVQDAWDGNFDPPRARFKWLLVPQRQETEATRYWDLPA